MYAPPGVLLWVSNGVLVAQRFNPASGVLSDKPIPVARAVGVDDGLFRGAFAVSATGVLAHRTGQGERRQLAWIDCSGTTLGTVAPPDEDGLSSPELAPDGQRIAVHRTVDGNHDVWLINTGGPPRFTVNASIEGAPLWSPDGTRVVFASMRNGVFDLFERAASLAGDEQPLLVTGEQKTPMDWSSDGRFLLYATQHPKTGADLWALPLSGGKPFPVVDGPFNEMAGQFSPDGKWLAYQSNRVQPHADLYSTFSGSWRTLASVDGADRRESATLAA